MPVRSTDLPKRETGTGQKHVGKRADWETVHQRCSPKTWMIGVKLNCFKSSGQLETGTPLTTRLRSRPGDNCLTEPSNEILSSGTMVNETYHTTNGYPTPSC